MSVEVNTLTKTDPNQTPNPNESSCPLTAESDERLSLRLLNPATRSQAENMARFAGIAVLPVTTLLYGVLREKRDPSSDQGITPESDQHLFARALQLTNRSEDHATFVDQLPHIFKKK